jgi:hypothetical protein
VRDLFRGDSGIRFFFFFGFSESGTGLQIVGLKKQMGLKFLLNLANAWKGAIVDFAINTSH